MLSFLKSAIFRGLLILLPVLFLIIILQEFVELLIGLATPLAELFPTAFIDKFPDPEILAGLLIVVAALVLGIFSLLPPGAAAGRFIERQTLNRLPVYQPLKTLLHALLGAEESDSFRPALLNVGDGVLEPAYIVEDHGGPRLVMMVPWTPASFAGSLKYIPREQVYKLDLTLDEFSLAIGNYGVGLHGLIDAADLPEAFRMAPRATDS